MERTPGDAVMRPGPSGLYGTDIDDDTLRKAADEALTMPRDYMAWDDRWYTTHGHVMSWAERGDDILAESNYLTAVEHLTAVATSWADVEHPDWVVDSSASHWLVGSMRELMVRVYEPGHFTCCPQDCPEDEHGEECPCGCAHPGWCRCEPIVHDRVGEPRFTDVFREAVGIALAIRDYPVLNESDYSERESAESDRQLNDALREAAGRYEDGEDEDVIRERFYALFADGDSNKIQESITCGDYPNVSYLAVWEVYEGIRNALYTDRAEVHLAADRAALVLPGQLPLPGVGD